MSSVIPPYKPHYSLCSPSKTEQTSEIWDISLLYRHIQYKTNTITMAYKSSAAGLILIVVTVFWAGATAQSSSCTNVLISMSPCLNYITGNSSNPSSQCCQQLASVVRSSPQCLCEVLNGSGSSLGININQTQALALPGACNVQTPPINRCNGKNEIRNSQFNLNLMQTYHLLKPPVCCSCFSS